MAVFIEKIEGLDRLGGFFRSLPEGLEGGVSVEGPATAYALVWEFGSARVSKPGPKTTWGVNPRGERVVLTLTAPNGYIWIHREEYFTALREELTEVDLARSSDWKAGFVGALERASARAATMIQESAPFDTGQLRESVKAMEVSE